MDEIKELQTLATTKGVYNSFPDQTARKDLKAKLNAPDSVKAGDYLRVQSIGADGTVVLEGAEGSGNDSGQNLPQVEPAWGDTPLAFFGKPLQQTKDEIVCEFWYYSKTLKFHGWAKIKAQGNSTLGLPKKNQTVKLYKDEACTEKLKIDFKGWGKQNKFVIKAYWRDLTHARDVGSVRLESECAKSRPGYDTMPEQLRTSPNMGGIDGFPVLVYADGVYQGRYMWNIPKDAWMANMDDELDTHCILCSEDYNSSCFRAAANINGNDWTDEVHDTVPVSIKNRWNEVISFVRNASDEEFVSNLDGYIDVESLIDRHLVGLVSCDFDGYGKNQMYMTYDGQKWYAVPYDKDGTWGVFWTGNSMLPSNYGRNEYEDMTQGRPGNLLFIRLEQLFWQQLQERWAYLRNTTLSVANIIARMRELTDIVPPHIVAEDYASTTAGGAFTSIPNKDTCTIQQIQKFAAERHTWTDEYVAGLTPVVPVPCTGISLDKSTLTFTGKGTQTLTATVTPDGCTDVVTWESTDSTIASVSGGEVTARANGSATITAKCGEYSASCAVAVSGIDADGGGAGDENGGEIDYTLDALDGVEWLENKTYSKSTGELVAADGEYAAANKVSLQANARYALENNSGGTWPAFFLFDQDEAFIFTAEANIANGIPYNFAVRDGMMASVKVYAGGEPIDVENLTLKPVDNRASATGYKNVVLSEYQWTVNTEGKLECMIADFPNATSYAFNFDALVFNAGFDNTANADVFALNRYNENYYLVYLGKRTHDEFNTWVEENRVYLELNPHLKP